LGHPDPLLSTLTQSDDAPLFEGMSYGNETKKKSKMDGEKETEEKEEKIITNGVGWLYQASSQYYRQLPEEVFYI
jgi:hypothetical protein